MDAGQADRDGVAMGATLPSLLDGNRRWVDATDASDPDLFSRLSQGQAPEVLWIGCCDSRVPVERIVDVAPGVAFVHRNIANQATLEDPSVVAALTYGIEALGIRDVVICGHVGCGGVAAALSPAEDVPESVNRWIGPIRALAEAHAVELAAINSETERCLRLVELNVRSQVANVRRADPVACRLDGNDLVRVHGVVYELATGRLRTLEPTDV